MIEDKGKSATTFGGLSLARLARAGFLSLFPTLLGRLCLRVFRLIGFILLGLAVRRLHGSGRGFQRPDRYRVAIDGARDI